MLFRKYVENKRRKYTTGRWEKIVQVEFAVIVQARCLHSKFRRHKSKHRRPIRVRPRVSPIAREQRSIPWIVNKR